MSDGPFIRPKATKQVGGIKLPHVYVEGGTISTGASSPETIRIDDATTYQYFGYAPIASPESTAVWKISRLTVPSLKVMLT